MTLIENNCARCVHFQIVEPFYIRCGKGHEMNKMTRNPREKCPDWKTMDEEQ